jgi:DNA repair/transcription protein MET18/MMS19
LTTLDSCSKSYSVATISQFSSPVWEALKFEVWNGDNEEFIQGSLDVLQTVTSSLSRSAYDVTDNTSHLAKFVIQVANECGQRFHDNKHVYMVPTGRILRAVASGSPYAFYLVARSVLPALHTIWQDLTLPSEKKLLLTVFNDIVRARLAQVDIAPNPETDSPESTQKMQEYMKQSIRQMVDGFAGFRDRLLEAYFNDTTLLKTNTGPSGDVSFGIPAIQGLVLLFKIPSFLSPAEKGMVVEELNAISSNYTLDKEIHGEVILALEQISTTEPKMFKEIILVYMMEKLPQQVSLEPGKHEIELQSILACLQDLVQISCTSTCRKELDDGPSVGASTSFLHRNFDLMQIGLLKKFDEVFRHEGQLDYVIAILAAIFAGLERFDSVLAKAYAKAAAQEADSKVHPYDHIVFSLFQLIVEPKQHVADAYAERGWAYTGVAKLSDKNGKDDKFIQLVGRIAMSALRSSVTTAQNNFLLKWNESNIEEPSAIWTLFSKNPAHETLAVSQPHLEIGPAEKCLANVLSVYLLAGSRRDVSYSSILNFPQTLFSPY